MARLAPRRAFCLVKVLAVVSFCLLIIHMQWNGNPTTDVRAEKEENHKMKETTTVKASGDNRAATMDNLAKIMEEKTRGFHPIKTPSTFLENQKIAETTTVKADSRAAAMDNLALIMEQKARGTPSSNDSSQGKTVDEYKKIKAEEYIKKYANPAKKSDVPPTLATYGPDLQRPNPKAYIKDESTNVRTEEIRNVLAKEMDRRMKLGDTAILEIPEVQKEIAENPESVPNIIHFTWFSCHQYRVHDLIGMMSAAVIQKPRAILLHTNCVPTGEYWDAFVKEAGPKLKIVQRSPPTQVWGREVKVVEHQSDVARLEILLEVGGIYMDCDTVLLKPIDQFRNLTGRMVLAEQTYNALGNALLLANRNSWFLKRWYQEYGTFNDKSWAVTSCVVPLAMWQLFPSTVHVETRTMLRPNWLEADYIYQQLFDWSNNYSIHLYAREMLKSDGTSERSLKDLAILNSTYGEISRYILWGDKKPRDISFLM